MADRVIVGTNMIAHPTAQWLDVRPSVLTPTRKGFKEFVYMDGREFDLKEDTDLAQFIDACDSTRSVVIEPNPKDPADVVAKNLQKFVATAAP